ncbi:MAG: tRNA dimethylallyltransferase, partial [bacterium]|nr:tRNA dimethylallyltransferase [bacterium]
EVKPNCKLRAKLEKKTTRELFNELRKLDSNRAATIDPKNPRRLIRALEIVYKTGKPVPPLNPPQPSFTKGGSAPPFSKGRVGGILPFDVLFIGLKKSPQELKKLIHKRLLKRLKQGMIKEVENLRKSGLSWKRLNDLGLEYRWIAKYLQKKATYQEMTYRLQKEIEHFSKRQMTWFKRDNRIYWVRNKKQAQKLINKFIKKY